MHFIFEAEQIEDVEHAMKSVGFEEQETKTIWQLMASILHVGNIEFEADGETALIVNKGIWLIFIINDFDDELCSFL